MKNKICIIACFLLTGGFSVFSQNVSFNTTGAKADPKNMLEVLQPSVLDSSVGVFVRHFGNLGSNTIGTGVALGAIRDGVGLTNVAAFLSAKGGGNNYALIVPQDGGSVGIGTQTPFKDNKVDIKSNLQSVGLFSSSFGANEKNTGIIGEASKGKALNVGLLGKSVSELSNDTAYGVLGTVDITGGSIGVGVTGYIKSDNALKAVGVQGNVKQLSGGTSGDFFGGIFAATSGATNYGVYGSALGGAVNFAGYFDNGNVVVKNGNLGIGTVSPKYVLDVAGQINTRSKNAYRLWNDKQSVILRNDSNDFLIMITATDDPDGAWNNLRPFRINLATGSVYLGKNTDVYLGDSALVVKPNGNVGIGTTNTTQKLEVNGFVYSRSGFKFPDGSIQLTAAVSSNKFWSFSGNANVGTNDFIGTIVNKDFVIKTNSVERIRVKSTDGNVGVGCLSPSQKLYVSGNIYATGTVLGSQAACSDIRWKKDFEPLTGALQSVLSLNGLYYDWKKNEFPEKEFSSRREIGLIAQEVEKIYPELIFTDEKGFKYLDYSHLTPILIEAIKDLSAILEEQQQQFEVLKQENNSLKIKTSEIDGLKSENNALKLKNSKIESDIKTIQKYLNLEAKN